MKRLLTLLLAFVATHAVTADELIPIDTTDDRVIAEVAITISADALPAERTGSIYFVSIARATEEEMALRCGQDGYALVSPKEGWSWGYSISVTTDARTMTVDLSARRSDGEKEIEREASFTVPLYENSKGRRSGISYSIEWKKTPNQPSQPTRGKAPRG